MKPTEPLTPERAESSQPSMSFLQVRDTNEWLPASTQTSDILRAATPARATEEGYYGVPMLKRPLWHWHIALYFFCEGVSAGAFILASLADLFGGGRWQRLSRAGYYVSLAAIIPCPPLLIADLGVPSKFHHMLRIFKPSSPMNLGAWSLTGYSIPLQMIALRHLAADTDLLPPWLRRFLLRLVPERLAGILGIPTGMLMVAYPGVLLSTTSTPVWSRTRLLGALFSASSMVTGAAATSLALAFFNSDNRMSLGLLEKIERIASLCEGAALTGYLVSTGKAANPLLKGKYLPHTLLAGAAITSHLLPVKPVKQRRRGLLSTVLRSALTLAGGMALKWAIVYAGRKSAEDPQAARAATRPSKSAPGWGPTKSKGNTE
ncbi:MAG: NrfD/PsrC family molybdoenzyme membrane anchor subunit [Blastocatellia bacterium]